MIVIFSMYLLGIVVAILSGIILKRFVARGKTSNFIMELPEYRKPTMKNLGLHTWEKIRGFVVKAGTVLVLAFIVIWFLQQFDFTFHYVSDGSQSMFAQIGKWIAPIFTPLGFGDWHASSALLSGIVAKEAVVGTLEITGANLASIFTPLSAVAFMAFVLLYIPCVAALATLRREMNSLKWTGIAVGYQLLTAWIVGFLIFQVGSLLGF